MKQTENKEVKSENREGKEIILPSGKKAFIGKFKGKHVREATRIADGESDKILFAIISLCTTIDGERIIVEDIDEMPGGDVMKLTAEFAGVF